MFLEVFLAGFYEIYICLFADVWIDRFLDAAPITLFPGALFEICYLLLFI